MSFKHLPICLLLYILCFRNASAQSDLLWTDHFLKDSLINTQIQFSGNFFFASNAVTNKFARTYFQNGYLDNKTKGDVTSNLNRMNRLGGEANTSLDFIFRPDSNHRSVQAFASVRVRNYLLSDFSRDFFKLYFEGNAAYSGNTADLGGFRFTSLSYQQLAFGLGRMFPSVRLEDLEVPKEESASGDSDSTLNISSIPELGLRSIVTPQPSLYVGADVAITGGKRFLSIKTNQASIYTHNDGRNLDASIDAIIQRDDSSSVTLFDGFGGALDIFIQYVSEKNILRFSAENIGAIWWNKFSTDLVIDSSFIFKGVDVSDLFDASDSVKSTISVDSTYYYNFINNRKSQRVTTSLPWKTSLSYSAYFLHKRLLATIGSDILTTDILKSVRAYVRFYGMVDYRLNRTNEMSVVAAYGGYTTFHVGMSYAHWFPGKFRIEVGSSYLYPIILNRGTGQGGWFSLSKLF